MRLSLSMFNSVNKWSADWASQRSLAAHYLPNTNSTNTWSKTAYTGPADALYLTDFQTQGRGRNTNSWQTLQLGDASLATWCFSLTQPPTVVLPIRIGLATFTALKKTWSHIPFALKAPNDIFIEQKKMGGILIEVASSSTTQVYVGIGLNIYNAPAGIDRATAALCHYDSIQRDDWFEFCDRLYDGLQNAIAQKNSSTLAPQECLELTTALSLFYGPTFERIDSDGSLIFSDGTIIFWKDL